MVSKSIPEQIIEEFIESLKKSKLFDDALIEKIISQIENKKGVSKKDVLLSISAGVENEST